MASLRPRLSSPMKAGWKRSSGARKSSDSSEITCPSGSSYDLESGLKKDANKSNVDHFRYVQTTIAQKQDVKNKTSFFLTKDEVFAQFVQ